MHLHTVHTYISCLYYLEVLLQKFYFWYEVHVYGFAILYQENRFDMKQLLHIIQVCTYMCNATYRYFRYLTSKYASILVIGIILYQKREFRYMWDSVFVNVSNTYL